MILESPSFGSGNSATKTPFRSPPQPPGIQNFTGRTGREFSRLIHFEGVDDRTEFIDHRNGKVLVQ